MLVFNTLRGAAAVVQAELAHFLRTGVGSGAGPKQIWRKFGPTAAVDVESLAVGEADVETLIGLGMLVESWSAEESALCDFLQAYWHPPTLKLTMAYTAACQMACGYCFQSGRDLKKRHDAPLRQATVNFVGDYLKAHPELQRIHLGLFGGEPLLEPGIASKYIEEIQLLAQQHSLGLDLSLTTNGLELTRELILAWRERGLNYLRVTLDGPPDVHDRRRPARGGQPTFQKILRNLRQLRDIQGFGIGVSLNLDSENVDSVAELLDILDQADLRQEVEILLEATLPVQQKPGIALDDHYRQGEILSRALEQVVLKGFRTPVYPGLCIPCNFVQSNNFIIDWSGQLFRCTFTMLDSDVVVGSVTDGVQPDNERLLLQARQAVGYCLEQQCAYLPVCGGGCRYEAALRSGDWSGQNCPVDFWDQVLPHSIPYSLARAADGVALSET